MRYLSLLLLTLAGCGGAAARHAATTTAHPARADGARPSPKFDTFLFGVCYYPEQWPRDYWERDADRMRECGVNTVRMGEFAWALMEPEEGRFDFRWLDDAIDVLAKRGIRTILGTPTATP